MPVKSKTLGVRWSAECAWRRRLSHRQKFLFIHRDIIDELHNHHARLTSFDLSPEKLLRRLLQKRSLKLREPLEGSVAIMTAVGFVDIAKRVALLSRESGANVTPTSG